ncbi:MAG: glycosyltransferase [Candidatus Abyssobacteria bacterium SURF_5]|uniref:Glycosyltransferase n=1 Tax=Abyssobacteria bacterium (strain SURF_5) TaxID=2093360 RepID=A0A3A4P2L5_ABYX5|nr:MAG: glycosyltransferase [Candidatus Abyssubacteria bacterium SURF_5]
MITVFLLVLAAALGEYVLYNLIMLIAGLARSERKSSAFTPPLSVIIPVHNEERHIRRKLENVLQSEYPRERLEVVVVDDGSTDGTAQIVREFEREEVVLIETAERKGKITAQKTGFGRTSAPIIVITDATVLAPPDALKKLASHFEDPRVGAVSTAMVVRNRRTNYLTRIAQFLFDLQNAQKLGESSLDSAGGLFGQFSLVRREAIGDFRTDVIYEDREFGITLRRRGYRCRFEPSVQASYYAAESLEDFSRQKQRNIGAMTQSIFRHKDMLFNPRYGWYGLLILPEYSLFRVLRPCLIIAGFVGTFLSALAADPGVLVPLLIGMTGMTFACYLAGTMLLAPLVREPARFLLDVLTTAPVMVLILIQFAIGGIRYLRGDFDAMWQRVKRDRAL